ncbi:1-deoxy-D-xylulose 5-phosphate reductoisomerase [Azorhizobium sp. AG788]|uniref:1-deoxy-D-xylulose-5-phosphate reductoisomerase n=1 Tax=Azorhizobium sp. AG788 TaxID=2183897 RepID=UPI0010617FCB|nr:1-deoxy-D-xylulose-5-phosphate reductoisomerase [Azorhizobium sp. AG788]TDT94713.1 1-deoxy-D-xylulose 5-phosphate reductoisomerase [Azorhizobium sp. AG788]
MTSVSILGATGSVGRSTVKVLEGERERFRVEAVAGGRDAAGLADLAIHLGAKFAAVADDAAGAELKARLGGTGIACGAGRTAVLEAAARDADIVVAGISGIAGLEPTVAAFGAGRRIGVANKECLVAAGAFFTGEAERVGAEIFPVDSEHNAIFQALSAGPRAAVEKVQITASGGPFRTAPREAIAKAGPAAALKHPNWSMGAKITIDSATLMNKGLELIEAHHLFGVPPEQLEVIVHPESIVHGLVAFEDGSVVAVLAMPDMALPIAHCLSHPGRLPTTCRKLDLAALGRLTFEAPDLDRFPCLSLALSALGEGGAAPTILNGANEVVVAAFLEGRIGFYGISAIVEETLALATRGAAPASVAEALQLDAEARRIALSLLPKFAAKAS